MKKIIMSKTVVLPQENIDTDQIIPARFLTTTSKKGLGKFCFADWRLDNSNNPIEHTLNNIDTNQTSILVAGKNFGCGSSREHAVWALMDFGFRAVISSEIADIFQSNAYNNGLLPIVLNQQEHLWLLENPDSTITIDIEDCTIEFANRRKAEFKIPAFAQHCFLNNVDQLGFLLSKETDIKNFENQTKAKFR